MFYDTKYKSYHLKIIRFLFKTSAIALSLFFLFLLLRYIAPARYDFPEKKTFSGDKWYVPYKNLESANWFKANFHMHSRAWAGMTDGAENLDHEVFDVYKKAGYGTISISNYQNINKLYNDSSAYIPAYEHGYGFYKNHQLCLGAKKVTWFDLPFGQNIHHKQYIINLLKPTTELLSINHPAFFGGYTPEDFTYLTGYNFVEVLNGFRNSVAHWDSALSTGHPALIMANDDMHDIHDVSEIGRRFMWINAPSAGKQDVFNALRSGNAIGVQYSTSEELSFDEKALVLRQLPELKEFNLHNDSLELTFDSVAREFIVIADHGKVISQKVNTNQIKILLNTDYSYIRVEVLFADKQNKNKLHYYLNPILRSEQGLFPLMPETKINMTETWIYRLFLISFVLIIIILTGFYRKRTNNYFLRRISKLWRIHPGFGFNLNRNYRKMVYILLAVSAVIRIVLAAIVELGNDEVYYWTYALLPQWSYFDHPPMVGWLIHLTTFGLSFNTEIFVRFAAIIAGTLNTWLIFRIGTKLKDELTGWYASLFYTASIYGFIITGIFILPDSPQSVFWLGALLLMLHVISAEKITGKENLKMNFIGILIGLAMLSKYTTGFLWLGFLLTIALTNRRWLRSLWFYAANIWVVILLSPVIFWNISNNFISFLFHENRLDHGMALFDTGTFFTELGGEILYNNPVNYFLIMIAVVFVVRHYKEYKDIKVLLLLAVSLPLIITFLVIAMFQNTLPHWNALGITSLIPIAALYIRHKVHREKLMPWTAIASLAVITVILSVGIIQINTGFISLKQKSETQSNEGISDISLQVYGWRQLSSEFNIIRRNAEVNNKIEKNAPIISYRWFPAANLHYYLAFPGNLKVLAIGDLNQIHHYAWINQKEGGFKLNSDAWFITSSREYRRPNSFTNAYFRQVSEPDTIMITRMDKPAYYFLVYKMRDMQVKPPNPLK